MCTEDRVREIVREEIALIAKKEEKHQKLVNKKIPYIRNIRI